MYLGETSEYKEELAMLIQEFLEQRIQGMPNEDGVFVTPAFPKLIYALEEDNIHEIVNIGILLNSLLSVQLND